MSCETEGHCWHPKKGAIAMVVPDGHVVQQCCDCPAIRTIHEAHVGDPLKAGRLGKR